MSSAIVIPEAYAGVAAAIAFIGLVQIYIGGGVMGARKVFSSESFLKNPKVQSLQEEHKKHFGVPIQKLGYPDMGSGVYSQLLPYEDWVNFNNAQRAHYNMVEQTGPLCAAMAAVGLFYPEIVSLLGFIYGFGRILYAKGYRTNKGADGRLIGVLIVDLALLAVYVMAFYAMYTRTTIVQQLIGQVSKLF